LRGVETIELKRLIQKILPIQRIHLRRPETRVANNPAQRFFRRAVFHAGGTHNIFFQHPRANVIAVEEYPWFFSNWGIDMRKM